MAGRGLGSGEAGLNDTFGGMLFSQVGHHIFIPIQLLASCKLSRVRFYIQVPPNTTGRASLTLRVTTTPSYYAGEETNPPTPLPEFNLQTTNPANSDPTHWTTFMHEIDCGDLGVSGSDFTKMAFASVIMSETASKAVVFPGVKVAYKRTQVAV